VSRAFAGLAAGWWDGGNSQMSRTITWLARAAAFPLIGALLFANLPHDFQGRTLLIGCYVLVGLIEAVWILVGTLPAMAARRATLYPYILSALAAVSGLGCTPRHGDLMIIFTVTATLSAGGEVSILAGWVVAGAGILAIEVGSVAYGDGIGSIFGYPLVVIVGLLSGHNRHAYRIQAEQSAAMLAQSEQLREQERRADVLDERARIAREIHDVLAHSLGGLGIQIQVARAVLADQNDVDRALGVLASAQRMAADGLVETRRAVHALRSDTLPLAEELATVADTHRKRHGSDVAFDITGDPAPLPPAATMALLRIMQEALVNAAKHAPRQPVQVNLDYADPDVRLTVTNPLATEHHIETDQDLHTADAGYGLTGMRERLLLLGGTLTAGPKDGAWIVAAELGHQDPEGRTP
jgi:signal transduction histidine kinase